MMTPNCNLSNQETGAGGLSCVPGQVGTIVSSKTVRVTEEDPVSTTKRQKAHVSKRLYPGRHYTKEAGM